MTINWGDTPTAADLAGVLDAPADPAAGQSWWDTLLGSFNWDDFLWLGEPPDKLYDDTKGVVQTQIAAPVSRTYQQAVSDVQGAARDALNNATSAVPWGTVALVGISGLLAVAAFEKLAMPSGRRR